MRRLERRLELGDLLRVLARQLAQVALAAEAEELQVLAPWTVSPRRLTFGELDQVGMALVDLAQLELRLEAGVVEVVLLVELGDEPVGAGAVAVELAVGDAASVTAA